MSSEDFEEISYISVKLNENEFYISSCNNIGK